MRVQRVREERKAGWVIDSKLAVTNSKASKIGNNLYLIQTRRSFERLQVCKINYLRKYLLSQVNYDIF